ncbi:MAG: mechanosensitive ion channel domain-containing protein [Bacteroidota bacterium]
MELDSTAILGYVEKYGLPLLLAVITLIVGLMIIKVIVKGFSKVMNKRNVDASLQPFLKSLVSTVLKLMLVISIAQMVGIEMTSFVAVLGAAGLAIGLALSGTLQNFAGGVMILLFKPFKAGDIIDAQGYTGSVKEIQIFNTILKTPDNKTIIIPNGPLSTGAMTNYSTEPQRRVDFTFGIGYGDDIQKAKDVLKGIIDSDERILKDPEPFIALSELADSSVNFVVRVWVNSADYWGVFFDTNENVKITFDKEGLNIPFPQRDIHVYNH